MKKIINKLRDLIIGVVKQNPFDGILFSAGLDTAIIAAINPDVFCLSVALEDYSTDRYYASLLNKRIKLNHLEKKVSVDEAIEAIPKVISIIKSFDPAIPNDLAAFFGLSELKQKGIKSTASGDGSDEIFAGYLYMQEIEDLNVYLKDMSKDLFFSSNYIADNLGLELKQPYLDKEVIDLAMTIANDLKIRKEKGKIHGKWVLRKAFEDILGPEIAWQSKRPLESGSGMTALRKIIALKISDEEYKDNNYGIKFINREHLYFYKIYKQVVGEIPQISVGEKACFGCGAGMAINKFHCRVCGNGLSIDQIKDRSDKLMVEKHDQ